MDGYNIKIGVDSRSAERGVRSFSSSLNDSLKALRNFDDKARSAFKALDQFSKLNGANLSRSVGSISGAIERLNRIKVSRGLVNNLQTLQKTLAGIRFTGGDSLAKLPGALKALENIKINSKVINDLNSLKTAIKGFSSPPKSLAAWPKAISGFAKVSISPGLAKQLDALKGSLKGFTSPSKNIGRWAPALNGLSSVRVNAALPRQLTALKAAMRGFGGPSKGALALPKFLASLSKVSINPALASGLAKLKAAATGFPTISARAGANLTSLLTALRSANASDINRVAAALMRLNGLNINIGRTLANIANRNFGGTQNGINGLTNSMRGLYQQSMIVHNAMGLLQAALGGLTFSTFVKGIYETGNSWMALTRTLGAVSTSQAEVENHLQFIQDLTSKMPISIEAAAESYRKFAVAARLAGMSTKETQGIFEDFSIGFSAMGLSVESQKYAFIALEQMISKGNITMEELKTQLGDHLPGAVQILSQALDVPVAKLFKMIENGEVTGDALIKMGERVRTTFEAAAAAANQSSQGQFMSLQNAWSNFQKSIFNNGFNEAIGALAGTIADVLKSNDMKKFAEDIGAAFVRLFKAIAAVVNFLAQHRDTVIAFMKGFAAYGAAVATAYAFRMMLAPLGMLVPALGLAATAFGSLGTAIKFLATGGALRAVQSFFSFFSKRLMLAVAGVMVLGGAVYSLMGIIDELSGSDIQKALGDFGNSSLGFAKNALSGMSELANGVFETIDDAVDSGASGFDERMKKIGEAELTNASLMEKRRLEEEKMAASKLTQLSKEGEKLWDQLNVVGKENTEYQKQLKLLDEIAKKRGLSPEQKEGFRRVLDTQSLEDRNPVGGSIKGMREELDSLQAKTAEQKAFNAAKEWEQDMLSKGVVMTADEWKKAKAAVADYSLAVAKMNGEVGNGIERWVAKVGDFNSQVQDAISDGISGLSDELADFLSGAEADFAGLARSILKSFIKISLDGIMKDMFTSMGLNPMKSGQSQADAALAKLGQIGESITTAQTNVYTSGLSINGQPVGAGAGSGLFANTPLRGPLDDKGTSNANLTPNQMAAKMGLRGTYSQTHDFSKTQTDVGRNPSFDPAGIDKKFQLMEQEGRRIEQNLPDTIGTGAKTLSLSKQEITDLKKTLMTEWVPSEGEGQGKGIIDTILNRKASGKWGNSVTDVVNAKSQFSAINGGPAWKIGKNSVDDYADSTLDSGKGKLSSDLVDKYLAQRAAGVGSSVGDNLNYANRAHSDEKNLAWIDKLQGPQLGSHKHGTTADLEKFRPGEFEVKLPDDQARGLSRLVPGGLRMNGQTDTTAGKSGYDMVNGLNWDGQKMQDVKGLTLHHTGGRGTPGGVVDTLNKRGFGAQYIMDRDGKVFQTVPDGAQVSHMKNAQNGSGLNNSNALGMEMIAKNDQDLTPAQIESGKRWIEDMRAKYPGIGNNVYGHGELNAHKQQTEGMGVVNAWRQGQTQQGQLGQQPVQGLDPSVTGSIQSANNALKETGNALNQAMPGFQNLETNVQKTGTSAMTSGQQLQQAEQMKMIGEQQQVMSTQQAGVALQSAGSNASMASPQFQQAGAAIAQAGAAAGQGAQAAAAGASGGLGQLGSLLGMIPGMGQYGGLLSSFLGMFSEGGYATSPVSKMRVPHYAEGTANTSGGLPAVLHPNEAVIPLSRGRKVPVEIDSTNPEGYKSEYGQSRSGGPTIVNLNLHGVSDGDSFKRSKRQAQSMLAGAMQRNAQRDQ